MTLKLRQIHDALDAEVNRKRKHLVELKRDVEERNSQVSEPAYTATYFGVSWSENRKHAIEFRLSWQLFLSAKGHQSRRRIDTLK